MIAPTLSDGVTPAAHPPAAPYRDFLATKFRFAQPRGFDLPADAVSPVLKPHQRDAVRWAVQLGRAALFLAFGLGKTVVQLEILRAVLQHEWAAGNFARALIVLPLGVRTEFVHDADMLGYGRDADGRSLAPRFVRRTDEVDGDGLYLTNYESVRDGKLDVTLFMAVSLDEADILRSYGSKTYQTFLTLFDTVRYRFVATATPAPNRYKELIHYAGYLGVMDTGQALTRFFQRDSTSANNLTLYPHMEAEFFLWLHSWGLFVQSPADMGHDATGYDLPPLDVRYHEVATAAPVGKFERDGQAQLLADAALGLREAAEEKRESIAARVALTMEIVRGYLGEPEGVPAGVLRAEPRKDLGPVARAGTREVPGGSGRAQAAVEGVAGGEPGAVSRADASARGGEPGHDARAESGALRPEPGAGVAAVACAEAGTVRADAGVVRRDAGSTGESVRDLLRGDDAPRGGSLPCHWEGAGDPLPHMQLGVGAPAGQPRADASGGRVRDQIILWCDLNDEQAALERALDAAGLSYSSVHGSLSPEESERRLGEWRAGKTYALIGKPVMLGAGVNLQQCNKAIFVGITYKFRDWIQAVHRIYRFLQTRPVTVHVLHTDTEREVLKALRAKWTEDETLRTRMAEVIRTYGLSTTGFEAALARTIGATRQVARGTRYEVINNDSVEEYAATESNRFGLIVTSVPFGNHYEYSASYNDFGHNADHAAFFRQMDYLTPQLLRTLMPGRLLCVHVKDRIRFGNVTGDGFPTVEPFHADCIAHYRAHGFRYVGMITVVTDVVRENNQTYRLGWSEQCKDGTKMGVGSPEYVLLFRKLPTDTSKGYADVRVAKAKADYTRARWQLDAHAFWRSSGDRLVTADELASYGPDVLAKMYERYSRQTVYDFAEHVRIGQALEDRGALPATFMCLAPAAPDAAQEVPVHDASEWGAVGTAGTAGAAVWHDVVRMRTLNGEQTRRGLENHICPLQFDIVDRLIERYSNPGEEVSDPFGGLLTVPYRAMQLGRRGHACELKPEYWRDGLRYLRLAEEELGAPSLFDLEALTGAAADVAHPAETAEVGA